jgi:hypothetical protein
MTQSDDLRSIFDVAVESLGFVAQQAEQWLPFGVVLYRQGFKEAPGPTVTMQRDDFGLVLPDPSALPPETTFEEAADLVLGSLSALAAANHLRIAALCRQVFAAAEGDDRTAMMVWVEDAEGAAFRSYVPYVRDAGGNVTVSTDGVDLESIDEQQIFGS